MNLPYGSESCGACVEGLGCSGFVVFRVQGFRVQGLGFPGQGSKMQAVRV